MLLKLLKKIFFCGGITVQNERIHVGDFGGLNAKIILIGEAPGYWEEQKKAPFMGPSGQKLKEWWKLSGLSRNQFYITI